MTIDQFRYCFQELCNSFDLDFEQKKCRVGAYFNTRLGQLPEEKLLEVIKKAAETIEVKSNQLPPIKKLIDLYYTLTAPKKQRRLGENWKDAVCPDCNGTGWIMGEENGYSVVKGCCKCIIGQQKQRDTKLGQELGFADGSQSIGEAPF